MSQTGVTSPTATSARWWRRPRLRSVVATQGVLWFYAVISVGPLVLVFVGSFRSTGEILSEPLGLPATLSVANYRDAWQGANLSVYLFNSLVTSVGGVILCTAVSALVAYILGRWTFRGRSLLSAYFLVGLMLPLRLGGVPIFFVLQSLGLVDSRLGLILVYAAGGIPFAVFILTAFFRQLPMELEDAARIDGVGDFRLFWSIMLPLVKPAIVTVSAMNLVVNWNDLFFPLILLRSEEKFTITVGLTAFMGEYLNNYGTLFAGLVLAMLPLVVIFALATKQIVAGLTAGLNR